MSVLASVFFVLACLVALSGAYCLTKSSDRLPGLPWAIAGIVALTCWHALVAGLFSMVSIPVNLWSTGLSDLVIGGVLWWLIRRRHSLQRYAFHLVDWLTTTGLVVFAAAFFVLHTGGGQFKLHYATTDPAARLMEAVDVVKTQSVTSMFYHALTNGLLMRMLGPLTTMDYYSKIFVFSDGLFLVLAGLMFYGTIRRYLTSRLLIVLGLAITLVYLCAYPLTSTLYGFVYLSMSVVLIGYLTFIADSYLRDELDHWPAMILLMLGCLGLILCYSMFAPVVFITVALVLVVKQHRRGRLVSVETLLFGLTVFLPPVVFGLVYSYGGIFGEGMTMGTAIAAEGACYRDLFSNFLPFLPLALFGVLRVVQAKEVSLPLILLPATAVFACGLFVAGLLGKVSSYYFYKTYHVLWFAVVYLLMVGIARIRSRETGVLAALYGAVWAVVFALTVTNLDYRLSLDYPLFNPTAKTIMLNDIYNWNKETVRSPAGTLPPDQLELYRYVYENYVAKGSPPVPIVAYWEDAYWYQAISNQRDSAWVMTTPDPVMGMLAASQSKYVLVLTDVRSAGFEAHLDYFTALPIVYGNLAGFIAELPPSP